MSDIVERLRAITGQAGDHGDVQLCNGAADEIERLRAEVDRLRARPCPYVTGTVTRSCTLTPFTLTDAEREALHEAAGRYIAECDELFASGMNEAAIKMLPTQDVLMAWIGRCATGSV